MKNFLKLSKFRIITSIIITIVTALLFIIALAIDKDFGGEVPALGKAIIIFYYPAFLLADLVLKIIPYAKTCSMSFGGEVCVLNEVVYMPIYFFFSIAYVYMVACIIEHIYKYIKK